MRTITVALLSVALLIVSSLLLAGCVTTTADGIQLQPGTMGGGNPAAVLGMDPATYVHVLLERQDDDPVTFQLSPAEQAQLTAALDAADFYRNAAQSTTPEPVAPDAMQYRIHRRGVLLQGEVMTQDGSVPAWLEPLLPLLTNVLLAPDLARVQPYQPPVAVPAATPALTHTVPAPAAPAMVLLEFVRSQPGADVRVLLNLDRTYSVASVDGIREGQLARDEMATLLQLLEAADLRTRAGDYTPDEPCADCARYDVTYRNLLGGATVRGEEGALPEWLQALTEALVDAFIGTEAITAGATPTATLPIVSVTVVTTATASPAAPPPTATATPTPAIAVTSPTPVATAASPTPVVAAVSPTPAGEPAYSALDLLADLAGQGARVEASPGRITKPYLSVPGLIVQVDGQPVQVFQYADAAALAADVAGLAPNASSINGVPLAWPAAPHFWRKGGLLALAVSNDQALVDLISSVMGPQFAGR